jgi:predicted Fe-Mo cluster-binding NifX family protein
MHYALPMRIAIPQWQGRIAPVFDVAVNLLLIDMEDGQPMRREERRLFGAESSARVAEFLSCRAEILICGAISAPLESRLMVAGVQVIGFACGMVDEVLAAYLNGSLASRAFVMPGCQRWRRQEGEEAMPTGFGMGAGRGGGRRRQGRGQGPGAGRMGGASAAGLGGVCLCPKCGEKTPHAAGQPCMQMLCPRCGQPMTRG